MAGLVERLLAYSKFGKADIKEVPSSSEKWWASILSGIIFVVLSSAFLYGITSNLTERFGFKTWENNGPTLNGILVHGFVMIIIVRFLMT